MPQRGADRHAPSRAARAYRDGAARGTARRRRCARRCGRDTSPRPRRHVLDHREIVADEHDRSGRAPAAGRCSRLRICACTETSSAEVGSSQISTISGCRRARGRWRRAGAGRRRAGSDRRRTRARGRPTDLEQLATPARALRARADAVHASGRPDDRADRLARIERRIGVLEDRLDAPRDRVAADRSRSAGRRSRIVAGGRRQQAEQHARERGLAAAGLADDAEDLAALRPRAMTPSTARSVACGRTAAAERERFGDAASSTSASSGAVMRPPPAFGAARLRRRPARGSDTAWPAPRVAQRRRRLGAAGDARGGSDCGSGSPASVAEQRRHRARDRAEQERRARPARDGNAGQQAARIGMQRRARRSARPVPVSTIWPAYITATRSAMRATMPRSWVMRMHRHAEFALQVGEQMQDLRLDRDVERRRRLVGDDQRRAAHQRHRDHHALAQPAGELVRILARGARRGAVMPTLSSR